MNIIVLATTKTYFTSSAWISKAVRQTAVTSTPNNKFRAAWALPWGHVTQVKLVWTVTCCDEEYVHNERALKYKLAHNVYVYHIVDIQCI